MDKSKLQGLAQGRMSEEERKRALQAGANVSRYAVDPENVVPFAPRSAAERAALGLGGGRFPAGRSRPE